METTTRNAQTLTYPAAQVCLAHDKGQQFRTMFAALEGAQPRAILVDPPTAQLAARLLLTEKIDGYLLIRPVAGALYSVEVAGTDGSHEGWLVDAMSKHHNPLPIDQLAINQQKEVFQTNRRDFLL